MSPADVVNEQPRAYNARDIDAFVASYDEDVCIYNMPHAELSLRGRQKLREVDRGRVFSRAVMGNKVIDHEKTWGLRPKPVECAVVYKVEGPLITAVWFYEIGERSGPLPVTGTTG